MNVILASAIFKYSFQLSTVMYYSLCLICWNNTGMILLFYPSYIRTITSNKCLYFDSSCKMLNDDHHQDCVNYPSVYKSTFKDERQFGNKERGNLFSIQRFLSIFCCLVLYLFVISYFVAFGILSHLLQLFCNI